MQLSSGHLAAILAGATLVAAASATAADWPQWRGPNRDAHVSDFNAPQAWPKELTAKWTTNVGAGDATPALVGDHVYVFSREGEDEVTQCLSAADGKPIWTDKYPAVSVSGAASAHPGPRSSPAVADGKVVTLGVGGVLSCLDAGNGHVVWRKQSNKEFSPAWPMFYVASSPVIVDGMCVAHLGGRGNGAVVAYDLNTGDAKWKWEGEPPAYSSPVVTTVDGVNQIIEQGEKSLVGLSVSDGKLLWQEDFGGGGMGGGRGMRGGPGGRRGGGMMGRDYHAATPVVDGDTIILAGASIRAFKITQADGKFSVKQTWDNPQISTSFDTPVLKDNKVFGVSGSYALFCLDANTGKTLWTHALPGAGGSARGPSGFGSVIDAGPVLMALTPDADLIVFKPSDSQFSPVATYKVADSPTYAYPAVAGNRIVIKDQDAVILYEL